MNKVNWGILSTAKIAQNELIPAFQRASGAEVTAIATGSGIEKAKEVAEKFNIEKTYDSYEKLLDDPSIDAVFIPLPNHLHKKWVIEAAKRGKHILCEKPAALNTAEVMEMKKACEENQVIFMEAFMYHFHPQHERVREIIESGEIGEIKYMRAAFSFYLGKRENNIKMNKEGGGSIYDVGCYTIHSMRNVLQAEPETVHMHTVHEQENNVDTDATGYVTFPGGVRGIFDVSFNMAKRSEYEVIGTEGRIIVPRAYRPDWHGGDGLVVVEKPGTSRTETLNADQYRGEIEHISQAILNGDHKLKHDFDNTINNMRVIDACFRSIEEGRKAELT